MELTSELRADESPEHDGTMCLPGPILTKASAYIYLVWASRQNFEDDAGRYIQELLRTYRNDVEQALTLAHYDEKTITDERDNLMFWHVLQALNEDPDLIFKAGYPSISPSIDQFNGKWSLYKS